MAHDEMLDDFLEQQPPRVHRSDRRLAGLVREAYPVSYTHLTLPTILLV